MADAPSPMPVRKVYAATLGAAGATIIVTLAQSIWSWDAPVGLEGAIATVLAFAAGYLTPATDAEVGR